jgi:hypothetical protein
VTRESPIVDLGSKRRTRSFFASSGAEIPVLELNSLVPRLNRLHIDAAGQGGHCSRAIDRGTQPNDDLMAQANAYAMIRRSPRPPTSRPSTRWSAT